MVKVECWEKGRGEDGKGLDASWENGGAREGAKDGLSGGRWYAASLQDTGCLAGSFPGVLARAGWVSAGAEAPADVLWWGCMRLEEEGVGWRGGFGFVEEWVVGGKNSGREVR